MESRTDRTEPHPPAVDRRHFLALAASTLAVACVPSPPPSRLGGSAFKPLSVPHAELEELTITQLSARLASGDFTSRTLVQSYVARIEAIDRAGPSLRSVLELNPDADAIARALDDERRAGKIRGPLHGIPVLVKDNVDTGDRMLTTAGSLCLAGAPAPRDAHLIGRMRAAGAIVLGKTNLSEWANIRSARSTSGWSARGGLTKNPYALDRNASGSSSGSAVAVAANLTAVAIGTETDGSIVSPASICGLVGVKPTVGLVSRAGIIPISHRQDTAGPMARTVADAALLLGAIAGSDPRDPATLPARPPLDYTRFLDPNGARGARIGVVRGWPDVAPAVGSCFDAVVDVLRRLGAVVVDDLHLPSMGDLKAPELEALLTDLAEDMAVYLGTRPGQPVRALDDIVRFNLEHRREELRWFGQDLFEKAAATGGHEGSAYSAAVATCLRLTRDEGIDALIARDRLDALIAPTGGPAWRTDLVNGDSDTGSSSSPPAVAGYPSVTVPCGEVEGLPLGVLLFGPPWSEGTLLRIAFAYEQATRARRVPAYRPSVDA
jgi:amidase